MRDRPNRKRYMLYPEDRLKMNWDLLIAFILIITCSITPVTLAFYEEESISMVIFNLVINILFGIDIIVIFFTAFYNDDFVLIDDLSLIAKQYLKGWFLLDLLAIFPFEWLTPQESSTTQTDINGVTRIARLGRMYKLIKLTRLIRLVKVIK